MLKTKEHYELLSMFEKEFKTMRLDKETKDYWSQGLFYEDGNVNNLFLAYRQGYALGKISG